MKRRKKGMRCCCKVASDEDRHSPSVDVLRRNESEPEEVPDAEAEAGIVKEGEDALKELREEGWDANTCGLFFSTEEGAAIAPKKQKTKSGRGAEKQKQNQQQQHFKNPNPNSLIP